MVPAYSVAQGPQFHLTTPFQRADKIPEPLHVLIPVFNPRRYFRRWELAFDFLHACESNPSVVPWLVEIAFGEREFTMADPENPRHLRLRGNHEIWSKENALNLLAQRLPEDAKYLAWVDADLQFARPDWANETIQTLQHHPVVQMFSRAVNLSSDYEPLNTTGSFADSWVRGESTSVLSSTAEYYYYDYLPEGKLYPHPGYCMAMWRSVWDRLGGLLDTCILGGADWHMWHALVGTAAYTLRPQYTAQYKQIILEWQDRAARGVWHERPIQKNIGCVKGTVLHYWHGPKAARQYNVRTGILSNRKYVPSRDLKRNYQGLYQLALESDPELRRDAQRYFASRNEDAPSDRV